MLTSWKNVIWFASSHCDSAEIVFPPERIMILHDVIISERMRFFFLDRKLWKFKNALKSFFPWLFSLRQSFKTRLARSLFAILLNFEHWNRIKWTKFRKWNTEKESYSKFLKVCRKGETLFFKISSAFSSEMFELFQEQVLRSSCEIVFEKSRGSMLENEIELRLLCNFLSRSLNDRQFFIVTGSVMLSSQLGVSHRLNRVLKYLRQYFGAILFLLTIMTC